MRLRLEHLVEIWGKPFNQDLCVLDNVVGEITTDTRKLKRGNFFVIGPLINRINDIDLNSERNDKFENSSSPCSNNSLSLTC